MNAPRAVAFDPAGNLWVADTGNHRVLRFNATLLNSLTPPDADTVIGQGLLQRRREPRQPFDLRLRIQYALRPRFRPAEQSLRGGFQQCARSEVFRPAGPDGGRSGGQRRHRPAGIFTGTVPAQTSDATLAGSAGVTADSGNLYVTDPGDNRVLVFPLKSLSGGAQTVLGRIGFHHYHGECRSVSEGVPEYTLCAVRRQGRRRGQPLPDGHGQQSRPRLFRRLTNPPRRCGGKATFRETGPTRSKPRA